MTFNDFNLYNTQKIQSMTLKDTLNSSYQPLIHHPILEDNASSDILLRNKILKDRFLERCNDDVATLPIHEFKYERYIDIISYLYIYIYTYNMLCNFQYIYIICFSQG